MRWQIKREPENDYGKTWSLSFAFWPKRIGNEFVWLEWYEICTEIYYDTEHLKFKHSFRTVTFE